MATWNSRGLRGSTLEELINVTNDKYREKKLALVQKIPTPIKPITITKAEMIDDDSEGHHRVKFTVSYTPQENNSSEQ